jgi:hypothetical protein
LDAAFAFVGVGYGLDEAEAEAEAALGTTFIATEEALPDAREIVGGDADAGVADGDEDLGGVPLDGNIDLPALGGIFDGIIEEIGDSLAEAVLIGDGVAVFVGGEGDFEAAIVGDFGVEIGELAGELRDVDTPEIEFHGAGLDL